MRSSVYLDKNLCCGSSKEPSQCRPWSDRYRARTINIGLLTLLMTPNQITNSEDLDEMPHIIQSVHKELTTCGLSLSAQA